MRRFVAEHPAWSLVLGLALLGVVLQYWYIVALTGGVVLAVRWWLDRRAERAAIAGRAEYEHRMEMAGDPRGLYGQYPPARW